MIRLAWASSLLVCAVVIAQPRTTFRLENGIMFTRIAREGLYPAPNFDEEWHESYQHELRVFVKGAHESRAGYRVEPRFRFTHQTDSAEQFDWVLDQAYGYVNPSSRVTFLMGKQRARWGTGMTYTPTDNLQSAANPLDPTRYLEGVYLARVDATLPWCSVSAFYSPDRGEDSLLLDPRHYSRRMAGLRLFKLVGTVDLYASVMQSLDSETNIGGAFSWDSGPLVVYGEAAYYIPETQTLRHYLAYSHFMNGQPRAVLGASKLLGNSSFYTEVYYTGWGLNRSEYSEYLLRFRRGADAIHNQAFDPLAIIDYASFLVLSRPAQSLHQWYISASGVYNWRDLWTLGGNVVLEPVDQTLYAYPLISYIGYQNVDIAAGFSVAAGSPSSELPVLPAYQAGDVRFVIHF